MKRNRTELESLDICTLFVYRYILELDLSIRIENKANLVRNKIDLKQDILDLHQFPERLEGSYKIEWIADIIRMSHGSLPSDNEIKNKVQALNDWQHEELELLLDVIQRAEAVSQCPKVKVIKTPLRSYIESLIKI